VNRIQNIRKDKGFEITDRIEVLLKAPEAVQKAVQNNFDYIRNEILATRLEIVDNLQGEQVLSVEVDDEIQVLTSVNKYSNGH
ncbi:MAG: DUF5915 domain-containing protein, partial [bacterium]